MSSRSPSKKMCKAPSSKNVPEVPVSTSSVKIKFADNLEIELPILKPSMGPDMIDIRSLFKKSGHFSFDPGYTCSGSCASKITCIDGPGGVLSHRGYNIEQLAGKGSYMEVCFLLQYGFLPSKKEMQEYEQMM